MMATDRELLTYDEAAARFQVNAGTLRAWAMRRELRRYRRGDGRILLDAREVAELIERKNRVEPVE